MPEFEPSVHIACYEHLLPSPYHDTQCACTVIVYLALSLSLSLFWFNQTHIHLLSPLTCSLWKKLVHLLLMLLMLAFLIQLVCLMFSNCQLKLKPRVVQVADSIRRCRLKLLSELLISKLVIRLQHCRSELIKKKLLFSVFIIVCDKANIFFTLNII